MSVDPASVLPLNMVNWPTRARVRLRPFLRDDVVHQPQPAGDISIDLPPGSLLMASARGSLIVKLIRSIHVGQSLTGAVDHFLLDGLRAYAHDFDSVGEPVGSVRVGLGKADVINGSLTICP